MKVKGTEEFAMSRLMIGITLLLLFCYLLYRYIFDFISGFLLFISSCLLIKPQGPSM
jgi:preprotein translocase subunit SecD